MKVWGSTEQGQIALAEVEVHAWESWGEGTFVLSLKE